MNCIVKSPIVCVLGILGRVSKAVHDFLHPQVRSVIIELLNLCIIAISSYNPGPQTSLRLSWAWCNVSSQRPAQRDVVGSASMVPMPHLSSLHLGLSHTMRTLSKPSIPKPKPQILRPNPKPKNPQAPKSQTLIILKPKTPGILNPKKPPSGAGFRDSS